MKVFLILLGQLLGVTPLLSLGVRRKHRNPDAAHSHSVISRRSFQDGADNMDGRPEIEKIRVPDEMIGC